MKMYMLVSVLVSIISATPEVRDTGVYINSDTYITGKRCGVASTSSSVYPAATPLALVYGVPYVPASPIKCRIHPTTTTCKNDPTPIKCRIRPPPPPTTRTEKLAYPPLYTVPPIPPCTTTSELPPPTPTTTSSTCPPTLSTTIITSSSTLPPPPPSTKVIISSKTLPAAPTTTMIIPYVSFPPPQSTTMTTDISSITSIPSTSTTTTKTITTGSTTSSTPLTSQTTTTVRTSITTLPPPPTTTVPPMRTTTMPPRMTIPTMSTSTRYTPIPSIPPSPPPPAIQPPPPTVRQTPPPPPPSPVLQPPPPRPHPPARRPPSRGNYSPRTSGNHGRNSPLVFDINNDSLISAKRGIGISTDISRPFARSGGAFNGDMMLAMCDLNGNGVIDIQEVFGDQTIDPQTRKPLHLANGFQTLQAVGKEMQRRHADLNIFVNRGSSATNTTWVILPQLKIALQRQGCDLGFISDNDITTLHPLGDVFAVNVVNYQETPDDVRADGMVYKEKGSYYDLSGAERKVDDVWF